MKLFTLLFALACALAAGTLTVTVKDPSGAAVAGATVHAQASAGTPHDGATAKDGSITFPDLPAGTYRVSVRSPGFVEFAANAEVQPAGSTPLSVSLTIAPQETSVEVEEKTTALANSDPNYRKLRDASLTESLLVENLELKRDVGTFTFRTGTLSFPAPVLGRVTMAVFSGRGSFRLTPAVQLEADHINLITGQTQVDEEFESAVLVFTDGTYEELKRSLKTAADGGRNLTVLRDLHHQLRRREEFPRSVTEDLLQGSDVDNVEADVLADLYNPQGDGFFNAYIHGKKRSDLRFFLTPRGAIPVGLRCRFAGRGQRHAGGFAAALLRQRAAGAGPGRVLGQFSGGRTPAACRAARPDGRVEDQPGRERCRPPLPGLLAFQRLAAFQPEDLAVGRLGPAVDAQVGGHRLQCPAA